jgi:hypothetical protein
MKLWQKLILAFLALLILASLSLLLPPVQEVVFYRVGQLRILAQYTFFPPEESVFTPNLQVASIVEATLTQMAGQATPTATPEPTETATPLPLLPDEPTPTPITPTPTVTPLPPLAAIMQVPYVDQHYGFNNCAPANLTMALNFWGWTGKRDEVTKGLKPFERDKNVMPYEMVEFVNSRTGLRALYRFGGQFDVLKRLISAGFPVVVERGVYLRDLTGKVSWMGHYQTVHGYDDQYGHFQVKDSFEDGGDNFYVTYEDMVRGWRSFNYAFIVVYPPEREAEVLDLLGPYADETQANQIAAQLASDEIFRTSGQDQFFAYYNRGTSLVWLQDYANAAQVYDEAFRMYAALPAADRPWRVTWYNTGPYFAYFYTGRYADVIALADKTISGASEPYLEENWYWRARAKAALGDTAGAVEDLRKSLQYHPGFRPSVQFLSDLGYSP